MSELADLIEEPACGPNNGRTAGTSPDVEGGTVSLDTAQWQAAEFMRGGGWSVMTARERGWTQGMSAHRGVLHPDEYADIAALRPRVERELGYTAEQVHSVYRQGQLTPVQRELRDAIDARLLEIADAGGHMALLGQALGFPLKDNGNVRAMENALARARQKENR